jgi:hypothetical protein
MVTGETSWRKVLSRTLLFATAATVCGTAVWFVLQVNGVFDHVPFKTTKDVGRAIIRMEPTRPTNLSERENDARDIATAVAIDLEGERTDLLAEARIELIDVFLRTKQRLPGLTYRRLVARAVEMLTDDFKYSWPWQDRDVEVTAKRRQETVKELVPIVLERMKSGPGPGCAAKIIRAKMHWAGYAGGEWKAVKVIRTYPTDPRLEGKGFLTDFRCLPKAPS